MLREKRNDLADWDTTVAVQKLFGIEFQYEAALYDEFGVGSNPYRRGVSGMPGEPTYGFCYNAARCAKKNIEKMKASLEELRANKENMKDAIASLCEEVEQYRIGNFVDTARNKG